MSWVGGFLLLVCFTSILSKSIHSQSAIRKIYPTQHRRHNPYHIPKRRGQEIGPVAQDRRWHWIKHLKKQEKLKFKHFKKNFKKCGFSHPIKFKIFRRSDDGQMDTLQILIPYGYGDEYFPKSEVEDASDELYEQPPSYQTTQMPSSSNVYSVKYRDNAENNPATVPPILVYEPAAPTWRPSDLNAGDFNGKVDDEPKNITPTFYH